MASLTIYKASAGSGKTYTITGEYIRLLFEDPDNYRHILGVTFTNKATAEMKARIIAELYKLSIGGQSAYIKELGLKPDEAKRKSAFILYKILHDYSHFTISTIDSFFQRIIRTFAREMGFFQGFEIELDQKKILTAAVDELIFQLDKRPELKQWLVKFAEDKILEGQNWDINRDIENLGKEIFKENYKEFAGQIFAKISDKAYMDGYNKKLDGQYQQIEDHIRQLAIQAKVIIQKNGLQITDFKGRYGIGYFFDKLAKQADYEKWVISDTILKHLDNCEDWYAKKSDKQTAIENAYHEGLNKILSDLIHIYETDYIKLKSISAVQKHFYVLAMIGDLQAQIRNYTAEKNLFLISDTAELLYKLIKDSDAPFVYERTGSYINHFMIDEFQDTSMLQWKNFRPLVINSLAEGNANWVVGDVKQSIYRWRNSDWSILSEKIFDDIAPHKIDIESLKYNWRSCSNIIRFNNSFFRNALDVVALSNENNQESDENTNEFTRVLANAYADFAQLIPDSRKNNDGWLHFEFIDFENKKSNDWKETVLDKLPSVIDKIRDSGYNLSDIAILVRDKKEAGLIADYFLSYQKKTSGKYRYDILSGDSLLLKNAEIVKWIIACFKYINDPSDAENTAFLVYQYNSYIRNSDGYKIEDFLRPDRQIIIEPLVEEFLSNPILKNRSVFELTDEIIRYFNLHELKAELPFIQAMQDLLQEYVKREPVDIHSFLKWWDERADNKVISMPSDQEAMRLMTIHTAKGLEFPLVLIPFGNWEILKSGRAQQILWCTPPQEPFNELDLLPVNMTQSLTQTYFKDDYLHEKGLMYVDNLNLLYVAFTRAVDGLIVFSPDLEEDSLKNDLSTLIQKSLTEQRFELENVNYPAINLPQYYKLDQKIFEYGTLKKSVEKREAITGISLHDMEYTIRNVADVSKQVIPANDYLGDEKDIIASRMNRGKIMHEILQYTQTPADLDKAINRMIIEGKLAVSDSNHIKSIINLALETDLARDWFSGNWEIKAEASILLRDGQMYRPDRVMIKGKEAIIVDYKFGEEESPSHIKQVDTYMRYIRNMGYTIVNGWIWYISHNKFVPVGGKAEQLSMF